MRTRPWGASVADLPTDFTYTGQREAEEIGRIIMWRVGNARLFKRVGEARKVASERMNCFK